MSCFLKCVKFRKFEQLLSRFIYFLNVDKMKLKNPSHQKETVSFIIIFYYAAILLKAKTLKTIKIICT